MPNIRPFIYFPTFRLVLLTILFLSIFGFGQNNHNTDRRADRFLKSNARVNPSTLAMEFSLPLSGYAGRGGNSLPINVNYSSKVWQIRFAQNFTGINGNFYTDTYPLFARQSVSGWASNLSSPRINYENQVYNQMGQAWSSDSGAENPPVELLYYVKRVSVEMPDGSTIEFRKDDGAHNCGTSLTGCPMDYTGTFLAVDGSKAKLNFGASENTLYLPDGSRYIFNTAISSTNYAHTYLDRHGNKMTYNQTTKQWTDTMGRVLNDPLKDATAGVKNYQYPALNGQMMTISLTWETLSTQQTNLAYTSDRRCVGQQSPQNPLGPPRLFTTDVHERVCSTAQLFNPVVLTKITLPNGSQYKFKYNIYGEVERIDYPTGGYERFQYATVPVISATATMYDQANRGVTSRWVSPDGVTEYQWTYQATYSYQQPYKIKTTAPDGTYSEQLIHIENDTDTPFGFNHPKTGRSYEDRAFSPSGQMLRRKLTDWTFTGALNINGVTGNTNAKRDLRPIKEVSILFETGSSSALASLGETEYDTAGSSDLEQFSSLNGKRIKGYHYKVLDVSTAQNANITTIGNYFTSGDTASIGETDYLYSSNYSSRGIVGLAAESRIIDPANGQVRAKSQMFYDEGAYPIITQVGSLAGWENPNTPFRGNVTTTRKFTDIGANQFIDSHAQYDQFGNLLKVWDGRGILSQVEFNSTYSYAYPTKTISAVADPSGQNGSATSFETTTTYDYGSGLPLTATDAHGQVTTMEYNDALLRPTRVIPPTGGAITETVYNDTPNNVWVKVRTQIDGTNWAETTNFADGLGRVIKTQTKNSQGDVFSESIYDNMGRVKQVTNPYRIGETKYWTVTNYDELSRVKEVISPDNSKVQSFYELATSGNIGTVVVVNDQANKLRRSVTNGLGQLVRVDEPDDNGNLGTTASPVQPTSYSYDVLNNLLQVTQGVQQRNFVYDNSSRLKQATNPENGTINYSYDNNSNLTSKTDARGIVTTFAYDNLNRIKTRSYSDGTPAVTYIYDNLTYAKGRLIKVQSSISTTEYTQFDNLGRILSHRQTTDGTAYNTSYVYNLAGGLIEETYPSGRKVRNTLNTDGSLALVETQKAGQAWQMRAANFSYTSAGAVSSMQLGNGRWENMVFNVRLQPTQIGLGVNANDQSLLKLNYDYGTTDNNGNVKSQQITVTGQFTAIQNYSYDSLNRVKQATETISGSQTWKQTFIIDRYGNRKFDASQTTTLGGCPVNVCNPDISTTNNRVVGHSFDNSGNTTIDAEGKQFFYDAENKQKEVRNSSNQIIGQYFFDGDGKRIKKISNTETTIFVYDAGGQLIAEYSNQISQTPQVSYLTSDTLGSPRIITNASGAVVSRHDYMAFGEEISRQNYGTDAIRQKYTGYEKDTETDLDFAQARMYASKLGRFSTTDPLMASANAINPQTFNRYSYALNSPYKFTDPLGLASVSQGSPCGQFCRNTDGGGGYSGNYDSGHRAGVEGSILEEYYYWQEYNSSRPQHFWVADSSQLANENGADSSKPTIKVNINRKPDEFISIQGNTADDAIQNTIVPCGSNSDAVACTSTNHSFVTTRSKENGQIVTASVTYTLTITVTLPKWVSYNNASAEDKKKWDDFVAKRVEHEDVHVKLHTDGAYKIANSIPGKAKTANQLDKIENRNYEKARDFVRKQNRLYDSLTQIIRRLQ
jgi:RHS repeat-associated protein